MNYHNRDKCVDAIDDLLESYKYTPHSTTKIAPYNIYSGNILQACMNIVNAQTL